MLQTPSAPILNGSDLFAAWGKFPLHIEISPVVLAVLLALVGMFVAIVSVVLVYHWRRFPFEHEVFHRAERFYELGVIIFMLVAVFGILIS